METNSPHIVLLQNKRKMLRNVSRLHKYAKLIDIDISAEFPVIHPAAQLPVHFLLFLQAVQQFLLCNSYFSGKA